MPKLERILETALYVDDLDISDRFYRLTMNLERVLQTDTLWAYEVGGANILLLFKRGASLAPQNLHGGVIPPHDGHGPAHLCFAIAATELEAWTNRLDAHAIELEGRVQWPGGAESLYFRDPDGHMLELMTPGLWSAYSHS